MSSKHRKKYSALSFASWHRLLRGPGVHEEVVSDCPNSRFGGYWRWNFIFCFAPLKLQLPWQSLPPQEAGCFFLWPERWHLADNAVHTWMSKWRWVHRNINQGCLSVFWPSVFIRCALSRHIDSANRHLDEFETTKKSLTAWWEDWFFFPPGVIEKRKHFERLGANRKWWEKRLGHSGRDMKRRKENKYIFSSAERSDSF